MGPGDSRLFGVRSVPNTEQRFQAMGSDWVPLAWTEVVYPPAPQVGRSHQSLRCSVPTMADDTRSVTVDSKNRVSLGDLVEPGQKYAAWQHDGQIIMAPVVEIIWTPENAETLDRIEVFLKDPSTGVRRRRPVPRVTPESLAAARELIERDAALAEADQVRDAAWSAMERSEGGRG